MSGDSWALWVTAGATVLVVVVALIVYIWPRETEPAPATGPAEAPSDVETDWTAY